LREYEMVLIFNPDLEEEALSSSLEKLTGWIDSNGGSVISQEQWGRKRLAYPIRSFRQGIYVLARYNGESKLNQELEANLKFAEEVLRYLVVKKE
jgi:small subunit ribosomal protein S6